MSALSPYASGVLATVLVASMARAFFGPPADRPRRAAARALLCATAACYLAGAALVVLAGATLAGAILVVCGIEASCVGAWLVRGGRDDDDDGGGGDASDGDPPPWDWDAFDRARAAWGGRPRAGARGTATSPRGRSTSSGSAAPSRRSARAGRRASRR